MGDEAATILVAYSLHAVDRVLCPVDHRQRFHPVEQLIKRIVCSVPHVLQSDERFREFPDCRWKFLPCLLVPAGVFCAPVFKGAVNLMPRLAMRPTDDQVGGGTSQRMKHRVVCRADCAAQVGLFRPPRVVGR